MNTVVKRFEELTAEELYEILKLRAEVFVVEQNCVYLDMDDKDKGALHVFMKDEKGVFVYLRVLDKGVNYEQVSIGRVVARESERGKGYGKAVMLAGIKAAEEQFGADCIKIMAQSYAKGFYEKLGFAVTSEEFLFDDIPHIYMEREKK